MSDSHTLRGKPEDYDYRLNPSGSVTAKAKAGGRTTVILATGRVFFDANYYDLRSGVPVAKFGMPSAPPVPSVDPVQRVTIEYTSGRREVVE